MKTFKPTTPSRRHTVLTPYKELLSGKQRMSVIVCKSYLDLAAQAMLALSQPSGLPVS